MNRKKFLFISSLSAVGLVATVKGCDLESGPIQNDLKKVDTLLKISDEEIIREIGMIYLDRHPNENSTDKLEKLLLGNYELNKITDILIYNLMKEKIHLDFEQKNIVIIKGWILSVTETRQCALYALK